MSGIKHIKGFSILCLAVVALMGLVLSTGARAQVTENADGLKLTDDGMFYEPFFKHDSFLDIKDDVAEAVADGKLLVIFMEQPGCPYCREMHAVNLKMPEIQKYLIDNFHMLEINIWGSREVTDVDGETMEEKAFARKNRVMYTPTVLFFDENAQEVFRMPGYFKPFHFLHAFKYVRSGAYKNEGFQRWLSEEADKLREKGVEVKLW